MAHAYNFSKQEAESGYRVWDQSGLSSKFQASLGDTMIPCFKTISREHILKPKKMDLWLTNREAAQSKPKAQPCTSAPCLAGRGSHPVSPLGIHSKTGANSIVAISLLGLPWVWKRIISGKGLLKNWNTLDMCKERSNSFRHALPKEQSYLLLSRTPLKKTNSHQQ